MNLKKKSFFKSIYIKIKDWLFPYNGVIHLSPDKCRVYKGGRFHP